MLWRLVVLVAAATMSDAAGTTTAPQRLADVTNTSAAGHTATAAAAALRLPAAGERGPATQEAAQTMLGLGAVGDGVSAGGRGGLAVDGAGAHTLPPVAPCDENPPQLPGSSPPKLLPPPRGALIELSGAHLLHIQPAARRVVVMQGAQATPPFARPLCHSLLSPS